jgi:hypothetical protein
MQASPATAALLAAMLLLQLLPAAAGASGEPRCTARIVGRQLILTGSVPTSQRLVLEVNCSSRISSVKAYYGLNLIPSKVEVQGHTARVTLLNVPLLGNVTLHITCDSGSATIVVDATYEKLARFTPPTVNPKEEARRLASIESLIKRMYSEGITALITGAAMEPSSGGNSGAPGRGGSTTAAGQNGGWRGRVGDLVYFTLVAAALLYLLARYLPSLRAGARGWRGEGQR